MYYRRPKGGPRRDPSKYDRTPGADDDEDVEGAEFTEPEERGEEDGGWVPPEFLSVDDGDSPCVVVRFSPDEERSPDDRSEDEFGIKA